MAINRSSTTKQLKGNRKKLDKAPPYGKITKADFAALRKTKGKRNG
jgi:hypothetical protein|tara:strand:+ start:523 stop:660 length:138 start_codon:yes stop_codon:yes gene_type:complete